MRSARALIAASALAWLLVTPAQAQDVQLTASAGFAGLGKVQRWVPITVTVVNPGRATTGTLIIPPPANSTSRTEYRYVIDLPAGGRKQFRMHYRPSALESVVKVRLSTPRETRSVDAPLRLLDSAGLLFVVVGAPPGTFAAIGQMTFPPRPRAQLDMMSAGEGSAAQVTWLSPDDLPDQAAGYDSVDVVVLASPALDRVTDPQADALRRWVAGGGTLAVFAGPEGGNLTVPWLADLLPGSVGPLLTVPSLSGLTRVLGTSPPAAETGISALAPRPGSRVMAQQGGSALLVWRAYGAGRVTLGAFDPTRRPVEGWAGLDALWQWIGGQAMSAASVTHLAAEVPDTRRVFGGRSFGAMPTASPSLPNALRDIPELEPPSFWIILFFLIAYTLVLVPVNYMVLRRMDRQELAWVTTPAIVVAFTLLAYGIGFAMRGGEALVSVLTIVERGTDAAEAPATHFIGLFSPSATNYALALDLEPTAVSEVVFEESSAPAPPLVIGMSGTRQWVASARMNMWSQRAFQVAANADLGGPVRATLALQGTDLTGVIANQTRFDLLACRVLARGRSYTVGDLRAGETARLPVANPAASDTLSTRLRIIRDTARNALENQARLLDAPVLIGWVRQPAVPVLLNERPFAAEGVLGVIVHVEVSSGATVVERHARGWVAEATGDAGFDVGFGRRGMPGGDAVPLRLGKGELEVSFACPVLTVDGIQTLTLRVDGLTAAHTLRVLNRARGTWETPPARTTSGPFRTYDLSPRDYLDPGGRSLRVRVIGSSGASAELSAEAFYTVAP